MRLPFLKKGKKAPPAYEETSPPQGKEEPLALDLGGDSPKEASTPSFFGRLKRSLAGTRQNLVSRVERLVKGRGKIDENLLEELEEILIAADLGVSPTMQILSRLREQTARGELREPEQIRDALKSALEGILKRAEGRLELEGSEPFVILVIGVNGVGKTTTIGKLAWNLRNQGKKVLLAAADTFRAAASEQLEIWAQRVQADLIRHQAGADPAAVVFDALQAAGPRGAQVIIVDTAGRIHTKNNLMEELKKIKRIIAREIPSAPHEVLLVLDANIGQNSISQTRFFHEALGITGLVLTKLDGTAKGGVVVNIVEEFGLPIRYIGIGEQMDDLREFNAQQFVAAIFDE